MINDDLEREREKNEAQIIIVIFLTCRSLSSSIITSSAISQCSHLVCKDQPFDKGNLLLYFSNRQYEKREKIT